MNVIIGADHGGFRLKQVIAGFIPVIGHEVMDVGAFHEDQSDDYPDIARAVAEAIMGGRAQRGILICGSGVGASIAASKFPGIRAAVCHDSYSAHQGVEHDDMNVLCLGERIIGEELAKEIVSLYLQAVFSGSDRHARRVQKVKAFEKEFMRL